MDGTTIGLIPANYIKILGKQNVEEQPSATSLPSDQASTSSVVPKTDFTSSADLEKLFQESDNKPM